MAASSWFAFPERDLISDLGTAMFYRFLLKVPRCSLDYKNKYGNKTETPIQKYIYIYELVPKLGNKGLYQKEGTRTQAPRIHSYPPFAGRYSPTLKGSALIQGRAYIYMYIYIHSFKYDKKLLDKKIGSRHPPKQWDSGHLSSRLHKAF